MKITICVVGTRGDVQPSVALAKGLKRAGHEVRLLTHALFENLAVDHGIEFLPLLGDPREGFTTAAVELGNNPLRIRRWLRENLRPLLRDGFRQTLEAVEGSDLILAASASIPAFHVAERIGIPAISIQLQPTTLTRAFPGAMVPPPPDWLPFKGAYNLWATKLGNQTVFQMLRPLTNECRQDILELPPLGFRHWWNLDAPDNDVPMIYAYSPAVLPKPPDWGPAKTVSGYWFLDEATDYEPTPELAAFLDRGPPPVYVGLGSIIDREREEMTRVVIEAMNTAGQRAILQSGWADLGSQETPDSILLVDDVPHDRLFPRCTAVVHHGGAGTTAAGLRAGLPTVVVPFFFDQSLWAWRVRELGAGPDWIPRKRLTASRLAAAIRQAVNDESMRVKAQAIGKCIRSEDGVGTAVSIIERFAQTAGHA
jgi:UDP:flavonoid glycosyltransferase YjiC (YdhE family)